MLARHLVSSVERQVHPEIFTAAPDAHFVLRDEVSLRAGIVLIADFAEDLVGLPPRAFAVARDPCGRYGGFAPDERGLGAAIPRLRGIVQFGMNLDVAGRDRIFGVGEELDPPIILCDAIRFARAAAPE